MAQDNAAVIRGFADEVITKGNIEAASQYAWDDVVEQVPLPGQGPGLEGLKDIMRAMRTGFPDIRFSIQEQIAEGNKVASRFEWTGTHQGEFLDFLQPDDLCGFGELSWIGWKKGASRTRGSSWTRSAL